MIDSVHESHPLNISALMSDSIPKPLYPCTNAFRSSRPSARGPSLPPPVSVYVVAMGPGL